MTQSNSLHPEEIYESKKGYSNKADLNQKTVRNATWGAILLTGAGLLFVIIGFAIAEINSWKDYFLLGAPAMLFILGLISIVLLRRGRVFLGTSLVFVANLIMPLVESLLQTDVGWAVFVYTFVSSVLLIWRSLPNASRRWSSILAGLALLTIVVIELVDSPIRISPADELVTFIIVVTAILTVSFIFQAVRQSWRVVARNLRIKITVWTGAIVAVLSIVLVSYSVITFRQAAIAAAQQNALDVVTSHASLIHADTEIPLNTARALAHALTALKDPSAEVFLSRNQVNALLRQVLIANPSFLGTYTLWEPQAFDSLDASYRNAEAHDETGRFIPYWVRGDDGSVSVIALEQYETPGIGDWYLLPRQSQKEVTIAPLIYPIQGVDTVMASFVVPIMYDGRFYGIAGVDAPISFVQDIVDSIDLYDGKANAVLLTSSGTLISVRNRPEMVNQPATEIYADFSDLQARIEAGETFISPSADGRYLRVFAPVELGRTGTHWAFGLIIPFSEITAEATNSALIQAGISLVLIILALYLVWFLNGQVVRPLRELTNVANTVSQGNLDVNVDIQAEDETGVLAGAFNFMISQLRDLLTTMEQRIAERTKNLELAAEIGRSVSQVRELDVMLKDACELIQKEFDLYYVQVYIADPNQSALVLYAGTGTVGMQLLERKHRLQLNTGSINGRAAVEKRTMVISDTTESADFRPNPLLPDTRGEMAVPLIVGERVAGVLDMQSSVPGILNEEVLPAFEALAGQLAVAIQNANLVTEAQKARAEVEAQARYLVRTGWGEYLDGIHKPEHMGFSFDQSEVKPLVETEDTQLPVEGKVLSAPIALTGEVLGSLLVEVDEENQTEQTGELVNIVARQVAQQIENLRLLESAERYRFEAEQAARRQTREGWQDYIQTRTSDDLGYLFDLNEVHPYRNFHGTDESALTLPLKVRDEAIGRLSVQGLAPDDGEAVDLANAVAERLGAHIESLRQYDRTQSALVQSEKLFDASRRLTQATDLQELVAATVNTLDISQVNRAVLTTFDYDSAGDIEQLTIIANWWNETGHEVTPIGTRYPLEVIRAMPMFVSPTPVFFNDTFHDERVDATTMELVKKLNLRAVAVLPLHTVSRQLGALILEAEEPHNFTPDETRLYTSLAPQIATVLENRQQYERAQRQAEREAMLNTINQKIQSATSVDAVLQIAARELGHALGAPMTIAQLSMKDQN